MRYNTRSSVWYITHNSTNKVRLNTLMECYRKNYLWTFMVITTSNVVSRWATVPQHVLVKWLYLPCARSICGQKTLCTVRRSHTRTNGM